MAPSLAEGVFMKLFTAVVLGVSLATVSSAAFAADPIVMAPPMMSQPVNDWSGFYAGLHAGYGTGTIDWTSDGVVAGTVVGTDDGSFDVDGFFGGGQIGFNSQFDMFVLGAEADISAASITGEGGPIDPLDATPSVPSASIDWMGTVRLKAGIAADSFMVYATGGIAYGGGSFTVTNVDGANDTRTEDAGFIGWTLGVGAEAMVTDSISIKAEYLYAALTTEEVDLGAAPPLTGILANSDIGLHTVKAGINFHF
jgi:outer membrane immunogenic protein